jgi:hypothetical protein
MPSSAKTVWLPCRQTKKGAISNMTYQYFHDPIQRILYRQNSSPNVFEQRTGGTLTGWTFRLSIDVVRADNCLTSHNRWHFATTDHTEQTMDSMRYSLAEAQDFFLTRHSAERKSVSTEEISETLYSELEVTYRAEARSNRRETE